MTVSIHEPLSAQKAKEFRQWARDNDPPNPEWWDNYHPECRTEWLKRGIMPRKIAAEHLQKASRFLAGVDGPIGMINMLDIIADSLDENTDDLL
jgi:hypothetical protein